MRRARELAGVPFEAPVVAAAGAAEPAQLRRLPRHPLPPRQSPARRRRRSVPDAALPSRLPLPAPGDGERHPRRGADAGALPAGAVRLRPQQDRAAAAGQSRLCGLPPALSPERSEGARRAHRLPRRELFPLPRARTRNTASRRAGLAINVEGGEAEEFPHFREFWIEMPKPNDDRAIDLRPARQPVRRRRLPVRDLSVEGDDPRHHGHAVPAPAAHQCGPRSPHLDVSSRARTTASRTDDFRPELHDSDGLLMQSGRRRVDLAPPAQSGREDDLLLQRQQPARLRPDAARPGVRELPGPGGASTISGPATGSSPSANGARAGSSWSRSRRRTRPTTTSSPIGSRAGPTSRARRSPSPTACAPRRRSARMHPGGKVVNTFQTPPRASGSNAPERSDGIAASSSISPAATWPITSAPRSRCSWCPPPRSGQITHTFLMPNAAYRRLPRRHRREAGAGPVHRPARLPARRQPGPDRDLDLSLVRGVIHASSRCHPRRPKGWGGDPLTAAAAPDSLPLR